MRIKAEKRKPTPEEQKDIQLFDHEGNLYLEAAKKQGWRPLTKEDREGYLLAIKLGIKMRK